MGCSGSKASALEEINKIISQLSSECEQLEYERDKLKVEHHDRTDDDKNALHDLRQMHNEFEKELNELKEAMCSYMPETNKADDISIKTAIESITKLQNELEEKSEKVKNIINRGEEIKSEQEYYENLIVEAESKVKELDNTIEAQEEIINSNDGLDEEISRLEKEKIFLTKELKAAEMLNKELEDELRENNASPLSNKIA